MSEAKPLKSRAEQLAEDIAGDLLIAPDGETCRRLVLVGRHNLSAGSWEFDNLRARILQHLQPALENPEKK